MNFSCYLKKCPGVWIAALICVFIGGLYFGFIKNSETGKLSNAYEVVQTWEMPNELNEISGIAYIGDSKIACIQDEEGKIFVFDISDGKITDIVTFGETGDYESIIVVNETAYILRSDGSLFEITNFLGDAESIEVQFHPANFPKSYDFEGLAFDINENRLLLSVKEIKKADQDFRPIYSFDLKNKTFTDNPVRKLQYPFKEKDVKFRPSEIAMENGVFYVLLSKKQALLQYDKTDSAQIYRLNENEFPQPEGLTFNQDGTMFISTEGSPGKIFQVKLKP